ncbi:flagellar biosynthetic protein FliQ [Helicobacter typhlonius]
MPKILAVVVVIIFAMPWMMNMITEYARMLFTMISNINF